MKDNVIIFLDDKDISVNLSGYGNAYHLSIYNDKTNKAVATQISRKKLMELAELLNKYLENN